MRLLLQGRGHSGESRGGDTTLVSALSNRLEELGHEVSVAPAPPASRRSFDVIHAINLDRSVLPETEAIAAYAEAEGIPLVLTPLWWPLTRFVREMTLADAIGFRVRGSRLARFSRERRIGSLRGLVARQGRLIHSASAVLVTGAAEKDAMSRTFGSFPARVVPLGTSEKPPEEETERHGVVCVGRIDPRKNQLGLIAATTRSGLPLDLVGTEAVFPAYARRCRAAAGANVRFRGYLPAEEVSALLGSARVHALPSYFELPGLVSLDAAARGAAPVVSRYGTALDYFGDDAVACGTDAESIAAAVERAHEQGAPAGLASRISQNYSWERSAQAHEEVYMSAATRRL